MSKAKIMIAAPGSGSGKTLITCALLSALKNRGLKVNAFKCGPDYIDPLYHETILGVPSRNLDLFFTDEEVTGCLFEEDNEADISVIEGVMGLYDGLGGVSETASSYHLAKTLHAPVILVVNGTGMGRSLIALIRGFLDMDSDHLIAGVILNKISPSWYGILKSAIEEELHLKVLGHVPILTDIHLESRYLGLKLPWEIENIKQMANEAGRILEQTVDIEEILGIANDREDCRDDDKDVAEDRPSLCDILGINADNGEDLSPRRKVRIAVAKDEAFCFIYKDNIRILEMAGAGIVYFSPLHDTHLPEQIDGLILYGGYPELHAKALSANKEMLESIRSFLKEGLPYLAECGGFMYLHDAITDRDGISYPMAGVIPGKCEYKGKLVRFGYVKIEEKSEHFLPEGEQISAHEFHYYDSSDNGDDCTAYKGSNPDRHWDCIHESRCSMAGFPHLYYPSNPQIAVRFVKTCAERKCKR